MASTAAYNGQHHGNGGVRISGQVLSLFVAPVVVGFIIASGTWVYSQLVVDAAQNETLSVHRQRLDTHDKSLDRIDAKLDRILERLE